jgi:peptidoglycan LD-endopeptidase LytH
MRSKHATRENARRVRRGASIAAAGALVVAAGAALARPPVAASGQQATPVIDSMEGAAIAAVPAVREVPPGPAFPMSPVPRCNILDSFGDVRSGGRRHEGVDMLATLGQEVYAATGGVLALRYVAGAPDATLAGNAWQSVTGDGSQYFYAHLSEFAPGLQVGDVVRRGQLIGYVGDTGNPGPGNYHLHFEYHPMGGAAVDPLPLLPIPDGCRVF